MKPVVTFEQAKEHFIDNREHSIFVKVMSDFYPNKQPHAGFAMNEAAHWSVNIDQFEIIDDWRLKDYRLLKSGIEASGLLVDQQKHIFIYDDINSNSSQTGSRFDASARLYTILCLLGFENVSIIHDVLVTEDSVHEFLQTLEVGSSNPKVTTVRSIHQQYHQTHSQNHLLSHSQMTEVLSGAKGGYYLLDARTQREFLGLDAGYCYVERAGKIENAINVCSGDFQASESEGLYALLNRLEQALLLRNITSNDFIIWYCGTSWRASRMFVLTKALGYSNVHIYDGGWYEWQSYLKGV